MIDKSEQFVGDNFSKYSRKWLEETYRVQFTDRQWDILVDYCSEAIDEDEYEEDLLYAVRNIDRLEADWGDYSEALNEAEKRRGTNDKD